jgi:hypothetical protein
MTVTELVCPCCWASLAIGRRLPVGKKVWCPKCGTGFTSPAVERAPGAAEARKPPARPNRRRVPVWVPVVSKLLLIGVIGVTLIHATTAPRGREAPAAKAAGQAAPRPGAAAAAGGGAPKPEQPAPPDDPTVLIGGYQPLTRGLMDRHTRMVESILDIRLTEPQRRQWQQIWLESWMKKDPARQALLLAAVWQDDAWWEGVGKLSGAERELVLAQTGARYLDRLRKSTDADDQRLAAQSDEVHKPGGERNPVLVGGDPPLTRELFDHWRLEVEYALDLSLTAPQRQEFQRLYIGDGKKTDPKGWSNNIETWRRLLSADEYDRRVWRAHERPLLLENLRKSDAENERWLLAAYQAAHKPGGERNPILAAGDPPLTRDLVDQYGDAVEGVLDFSISGGLTAPQRRDLQDLLVMNWKAMDKAAKEDFLQTPQQWPSQARLLARLRAAPPGDQLSQYLLEIFNKEQKNLARVQDPERRRPEGVRDALRAWPDGSYLRIHSAVGVYECVP